MLVEVVSWLDKLKVLAKLFKPVVPEMFDENNLLVVVYLLKIKRVFNNWLLAIDFLVGLFD